MRSCPVCRGPLVAYLGAVRDHVTGEAFALRRCPDCDLAVTDPVPASLDRFYPPWYRRFSRPAVAVLRRFYRWRIRGWVGRLRGGDRVLEVGCASGWMLHALRERGMRVVGTERSVERALPARRDGLPVFVGDLSALRPDARADLIVLFHVLEHLDDPVRALAACAAHLTPGGHVVVAVPTLASWQARVFGAHWFHLDVPRHLVHFSPRALDRALAAAGLRRTGRSFVSAEHDPYGWLQSALDRLGFPQGTLTHALMGMRGSSPLVLLAAAALGVPLLAIGALLSMASWLTGSGAVMEVWAARAEVSPATTP